MRGCERLPLAEMEGPLDGMDCWRRGNLPAGPAGCYNRQPEAPQSKAVGSLLERGTREAAMLEGLYVKYRRKASIAGACVYY